MREINETYVKSITGESKVDIEYTICTIYLLRTLGSYSMKLLVSNDG